MNISYKINFTRILLNLVFTAFVLFTSLNNSSDNIPWYAILVYNLILFLPTWINNFWLLPSLRKHKKFLRYVTELITLFLLAIMVLGQYLHILYKEFQGSTINDFTSFAVTSEAPKIIENQQVYFDVYPGILILLIMMAIGYVLQEYLLKIKQKETIKAEQNIAELALLKSQISPHFLFNVLNSLYALSLKSSQETPDVILKLSDILRYSLYETQEKEIAISKEIHILKTYIEIEKLRIPSTTSISLQHENVIESVKIAPMLLLPLIENAFKHGTDSTIAASFVKIDLYCDQKKLIFMCENNYKEQSKNDFGGIGIENIRKRLVLIYASKHSLEIIKNNNIFKVILEIKF